MKRLYQEKINVPYDSVEAKKAASLFLDRAGIDGMNIPSSSGGIPGKKRGMKNYIFFNEKNITIENARRITPED